MSGTQTRPVVVGVDETAAALRAVRWAATQAGRRGTGLRLVHAVGTDGDGEAEALRAAEAVAGMPVTVATDVVSAAELLVRESAGASLVVLGTRGHGGFSGRMIGATVTTLAARGRCPMVVLGGTDEPAAGPVVVGVDGTQTSDAAVAFAFREAALRGTDLLAVHGWTPPVSYGTAALGYDRADDVAEVVAARLTGWRERYPEVPVTREVVPDTPGRVLLDRASGAQLVVVGSRRRVGYRGLVLRSTGQYLLDRAPCPVAVVRSDHGD
ncbi:MAG: universal stress protein [Actinophytocola sp.]|nr:universal stress protein [Actinophytocola sp.]